MYYTTLHNIASRLSQWEHTSKVIAACSEETTVSTPIPFSTLVQELGVVEAINALHTLLDDDPEIVRRVKLLNIRLHTMSDNIENYAILCNIAALTSTDTETFDRMWEQHIKLRATYSPLYHNASTWDIIHDSYNFAFMYLGDYADVTEVFTDLFCQPEGCTPAQFRATLNSHSVLRAIEMLNNIPVDDKVRLFNIQVFARRVEYASTAVKGLAAAATVVYHNGDTAAFKRVWDKYEALRSPVCPIGADVAADARISAGDVPERDLLALFIPLFCQPN